MVATKGSSGAPQIIKRRYGEASVELGEHFVAHTVINLSGRALSLSQMASLIHDGELSIKEFKKIHCQYRPILQQVIQ